ncbi:glucosaminidase domain-containing protein [Puniceicoccaceae bacterium K14]|nr:glucosaminidase domain-containing protein [Puniceicoccaceae bacterium K14]
MKFLRNKNPDKQNRAQLVVWLSGVFALSLVIIYFVFRSGPVVEEDPVVMPDFSKIKDIQERKNAFFDFLLPFIEESNKHTLKVRREVKKLSAAYDKSGKLSEKTVERIRTLQATYKFDEEDEIDEYTFVDLLSRIDIIPASLALSQAALESGWGTSRFALEGNNLYGIWCYKPGCGMIPKRRPAGRSYEVQSFLSPKGCFDSYILNLNTNPHYGSLRAIRRAIRRNEGQLVGVDLAEGLERYSEEGFLYIEKIQRIIRSNDLERFDS